MEIERKFLVNKVPESGHPDSTFIHQYYINYEPEIRFRYANPTDGFIKYSVTKKTGLGLSRTEEEHEISRVTFNEMKSVMIGNSIYKRRARYVLGCGHIAELDLIQLPNDVELPFVVEVEFKSEIEAEEFIPPDWFGDEVTDSLAYKNHMIAQYGFPIKFKEKMNEK